jgi:hypothetical protein
MRKQQIEILRRKLDAISGDDPEAAHGKADAILLEAVPEDVRRAYERLTERCGWWASA